MEYQQLVTNSNPIDINSITDTTSLDYKNQLNLSFLINQADNQIASHLSLLADKVITQPNTFRSLNMTIESYLYILLTISTTTTLDNSQSSSYYAKRKDLDPTIYEPIDSTYLQDLTFTNYKPWLAKPGSIGYYLALSQNDLHYSNPSTLIRNSVIKAISSLPSDSFSSSLLGLLDSDLEGDDINLYNTSYSILQELDLLKINKLLTFLEGWIPNLLNWYMSNYNSLKGIVNTYTKGTAAYTAFNLLVNIAQQVLQQGLFNQVVTNLQYKFYHQDLDIPIIESINTIINLRKLNDFPITNATLTIEESLCQELFDGVSILISSNLLTEESYNLLLNFPYKGGMNFWLTLISIELLNRAYIISHPSVSPYSSNILDLGSNNTDYLNTLTRVMKLIFYSGYCLKKCNMDSLNILGSNIRLLSTLDTDTSLIEYNLLQ